MTDFETFFLDDLSTNVYRMHKYRRIGDWTPYEMDKKFSDESNLESNKCQLVRFKQAIQLPDGDILLEYINIELDEENPLHEFIKLSEMYFYRFEKDNKEDFDEY